MKTIKKTLFASLAISAGLFVGCDIKYNHEVEPGPPHTFEVTFESGKYAGEVYSGTVENTGKATKYSNYSNSGATGKDIYLSFFGDSTLMFMGTIRYDEADGFAKDFHDGSGSGLSTFQILYDAPNSDTLDYFTGIDGSINMNDLSYKKIGNTNCATYDMSFSGVFVANEKDTARISGVLKVNLPPE